MYKAWETWAHKVGVFPMDTREYGIRSQAYKRMINGEFDMDFGDWDIQNPNQGGRFCHRQNRKDIGQ